jgi:hypothetical protein
MVVTTRLVCMPAIARVMVEGLKAAEFANFFEARQVRGGGNQEGN